MVADDRAGRGRQAPRRWRSAGGQGTGAGAGRRRTGGAPRSRRGGGGCRGRRPGARSCRGARWPDPWRRRVAIDGPRETDRARGAGRRPRPGWPGSGGNRGRAAIWTRIESTARPSSSRSSTPSAVGGHARHGARPGLAVADRGRTFVPPRRKRPPCSDPRSPGCADRRGETGGRTRGKATHRPAPRRGRRSRRSRTAAASSTRAPEAKRTRPSARGRRSRRWPARAACASSAS